MTQKGITPYTLLEKAWAAHRRLEYLKNFSHLLDDTEIDDLNKSLHHIENIIKSLHKKFKIEGHYDKTQPVSISVGFKDVFS